MKKLNPPFKWMTRWVAAVAGCVIGLLNTTQTNIVEAYEGLGGPPHIGTFEGSTTFTTSSSNGINPGLYLEVMDAEGNYTEYTSEEGIITIPGTQEGAYVTQAKLLGKTKYRDQETGEILDNWEDGRNLELESVQMPVLKTTGKNLFDGLSYIDGFIAQGNNYTVSSDNDVTSILINVNKNTDYILSAKTNFSRSIVGGSLTPISIGTKTTVLNSERIGNTIKFNSGNYTNIIIYLNETKINIEDIQVEKGSIATSYEPYRSNILSTSEDVELRGVGEVRDELNLLTGEVTERIGKIILDGTQSSVTYSSQYSNDDYYSFIFNMTNDGFEKAPSSPIGISCPITFQQNKMFSWTTAKEYVLIGSDGNTLIIKLLKSKLNNDNSISSLNTYLASNPITINYPLKTESVKTVGLNSTYYFDPVLNRDVRVNGTVLPLVASVTIPTEPLSFIIDPNQDEGQEFVAPEFSITNQTPGSIYLNLKAFEQTTNVLNDVLPTTYPDWHQLDKHQSKDIALALVPKPSDGWMSLTEGPRYVADSSNYELGMVKAKSTVDFTFSAFHGRTFIEELNPQYRLSFEFGF